jgi:hypothetical protein
VHAASIPHRTGDVNLKSPIGTAGIRPRLVAKQARLVMLNEVKHLGHECNQRLFIVLSPDPSLMLRMTERACKLALFSQVNQPQFSPITFFLDSSYRSFAHLGIGFVLHASPSAVSEGGPCQLSARQDKLALFSQRHHPLSSPITFFLDSG